MSSKFAMWAVWLWPAGDHVVIGNILAPSAMGLRYEVLNMSRPVINAPSCISAETALFRQQGIQQARCYRRCLAKRVISEVDPGPGCIGLVRGSPTA